MATILVEEPVQLTQICGPASMGTDRRLIQLGDDIQLNTDQALRLSNQLRAWVREEKIDAFDGTPVLDMKPFLPGYDTADDAKVPQWVGRTR